MTDLGEVRSQPRLPKPSTGGQDSLSQRWWGLALVIGLLVLLTVMGSVAYLVVVLAIVVMIFLHEMGHYLTARSAGMKVTEFFLGFGPRLWSFRRGETVYGLKAIPAGAYVRIIGMNSLDEVPPADEPRAYRQQPYWRRLSVAVAGSAVHFILALALIFSFLLFNGRVESIPSENWTVSGVVVGSPAEEAGLLPGDRIVAVDGTPVTLFDDLAAVLPAPNTPVELGVERNGEVLVRVLELAAHPLDSSRGYVGITSGTARVEQRGKESFLGAVPATFDEFGFMIKESVLGIGRVFSPSGLNDFYQEITNSGSETSASPVVVAEGGTSSVSSSEGTGRVTSIFGVVRAFTDLAEINYYNLLIALAWLNAFVGVFNLIPLLPFDGGHVVIATYERLRSRRGRNYMADAAKMIPVVYAVVLLLVFVFVGSLYLDVTDPIEILD